MENEKELWERLTAVEQAWKSANHRLDSLEELTRSVQTIAVEIKAMREDVNDVKARVDEMERRPAKRWDTLITAVLTAIAGGLVGYFINFMF